MIVANNATPKMRRTILLLGLMLVTTLVYAESYVDFDETDLEAPQNSYDIVTFDVQNLGKNDTLELSVKEKASFLYVAFSQSYFTENKDDNILIVGTGDELGDYAITLEYIYKNYEEILVDNVTQLDLVVTRDTINLELKVYTPMKTCFSSGIEEGGILKIGEINAELIKADLNEILLTISEDAYAINVGECEEINYPANKVEICAKDSFPAFNMAKIEVIAKDCPAMVNLLSEAEEKKENPSNPSTGKIIIEKLTKTYERGKNFVFRTLDNNSDDPIGNVYVVFGSREGYLGSVTTSNAPAALGEIKIPESFNESTFYITIEGGLPSGYNKTFTILTLKPWAEYIAEKTLTLSNLKGDKHKITGIVTNENGKAVYTAKIIIEQGDERYEEKPDTETGHFEFITNKSGEVALKAVRTDTDTAEFDSEWIRLLLEVDSDGDGVLDDEDKCPDEKGAKENEGCPKLKVEIEVSLGEEKEYLIGKEYTGRLVIDNKTLTGYTGNITIANENTRVEEGTFTVVPKVIGKHVLVFETNRYKTAKETIRVNDGASGGTLPFQLLGIIIISLGIIILAFKIFNKKGISIGKGESKRWKTTLRGVRAPGLQKVD